MNKLAAGFLRGLVPALCLLGLAAQVQAQATFRGRVVKDGSGDPIAGATVVIGELSLSSLTNDQGQYVLTVPAARVSGQQVTLTARAIGYKSVARIIPVLEGGERTVEFALATDVNRLEEIVVTGVVEGVERSKVPFSVGRVTADDLPIPALSSPVAALQGKVAGVRIAQTSGKPGTSPEILLRGPTSINAAGRGQGPLIIVDDAIMNVGSLEELGALDIESVEVVKGAAGASLYGTRAANGVISVRTKRGLVGQDGIRFNVRSEMGVSDFGSDYGIPTNHHLQLSETGDRFCAQVSGNAPCARTFNWMEEILRINNVAADTTRTPLNTVYNSGGNSTDLRNIFQVNRWPGQYYNTAAAILKTNLTQLTAVDATGRIGAVSFFVSGSYQDEPGAIRFLNGIQSRRGRVNLDYSPRSDLKIAVSSLYDNTSNDLRGFAFGTVLRGAPAGTNYLARDTLGRLLVRGGGSGLRGTGNGGAGFHYNGENFSDVRVSRRFLGSLTATYFPAEWVTFEGTFAYDSRARDDKTVVPKGYRTQTISTTNNPGNIALSNLFSESINAALTATFRKRFGSDLNTKLSFRGLYDEFSSENNGSSGVEFLVNGIDQTSNTRREYSTFSSSSLTQNVGLFAGATVDYKDRYILEGSFRYDGSSRFGPDHRWAPFGRVSGVWRVSEEPFWNVGFLNSFRLRASRGTAGTTPPFEAQYEVYGVTVTGITLDQAGNRNLKPETTIEYEFGADMELFNRIGLEVTHARGTTKDQILPVGTPAALGFTTQWQNAGTLKNNTWELAVTVPVMNNRNFFWNMRGTWDRNRTYISELFVPEFIYNGGTAQGTGTFFRMRQGERYGTIYGTKFLKSCAELPASFRSDCGGPTSAYQVNDKGWLVWVGSGNSWRDGITKNLWTTALPSSQAPYGRQLSFGHPIVLANPANGLAESMPLGNVFPDFRFTFTNDFQYKRLTVYTLLDATIGHEVHNQGEAWGLLDFNSANFDQAGESVETAKPVGYSWRCGPPCNASGTGGFYDALGPNNYNTETASYAKLREVSVSYKVGRIGGVGDWTVGVVGRNLFTITSYTGFDPEVGVAGGNTGSGLINQVDAFDFPTLRTYTFSLSTRF